MFEIYDINLAKILDKDYTIVKEDKESLEKLLYLLICNDKEKMKEVYDGDEFMAKIIREVNTQTDEFDKLLFYNREILEDEDSREEEIKEALAEGREQGLTEGRVEGIKETALAMLRKNYPIEDISEITKISLEEINALKDEL